MNWKDLKYTAAFLTPFITWWGFWNGGFFPYATVIFLFILIPIVELILPFDTSNLSSTTAEVKKNVFFFDLLLYLNIPIVYGTMIYTLWFVGVQPMTFGEWFGYKTAAALVLGSCGINVAHELGHRSTKFEQLLAKLLLLPSLYLHFTIEHNRGHHKNVATDADPASAKKNQIVYFFWLQSIFGGYRNAWRLERQRLQRQGIRFWSLKNEMLVSTVIQVLYLIIVYVYCGNNGLIMALAMALNSVLLLETINYIEHYGLRRQPSGNHFERVQPIHSWNSEHIAGRIVLYELTRHSDHHYLASKKYQVLDYYEKSPQLPFGYPASMLLSLLPPLWFGIMNKRIPKEHLQF